MAVPLPEDPSYNEWASANPEIVESYLGEIDTVAQPIPAEPVQADIAPAVEETIKPEPEVSIEPAVPPEPIDIPEQMDFPEPMDMPMDMDVDIPMDL